MTGHQDTPDISINTETSFLSDLSFNRSKAGVLNDGGTLINEASGSLFFQHPVRWDISGEELTYLNKLFSNTVPTPPGHLWTGGCYLWCGSLDSDGYARHYNSSRMWKPSMHQSASSTDIATEIE